MHTYIHIFIWVRNIEYVNEYMYVYMYVCMLVTHAITPSVRMSDFKQWNIVRYCPICIRCFKVSKGVMNRSCDTEAPDVKTFNDECDVQTVIMVVVIVVVLVLWW